MTGYGGPLEARRALTTRTRRSPYDGNPLIVEDSRFMRGAPVFNGTRVPIDIVLASLKGGFDLSQLQEVYPFLTQQLVDAAQIYVRVNKSASATAASKRARRRLLRSERIPVPHE